MFLRSQYINYNKNALLAKIPSIKQTLRNLLIKNSKKVHNTVINLDQTDSYLNSRHISRLNTSKIMNHSHR